MLLNSVEINLAGSRWNKIGSHENMFSIKVGKVACDKTMLKTGDSMWPLVFSRFPTWLTKTRKGKDLLLQKGLGYCGG